MVFVLGLLLQSPLVCISAGIPSRQVIPELRRLSPGSSFQSTHAYYHRTNMGRAAYRLSPLHPPVIALILKTYMPVVVTMSRSLSIAHSPTLSSTSPVSIRLVAAICSNKGSPPLPAYSVLSSPVLLSLCFPDAFFISRCRLYGMKSLPLSSPSHLPSRHAHPPYSPLCP